MTAPCFAVEIYTLLEPIGTYQYAVRGCPRCGANIGITDLMFRGGESIICVGAMPDGSVCRRHYYYRNNMLEWVEDLPADSEKLPAQFRRTPSLIARSA